MLMSSFDDRQHLHALADQPARVLEKRRCCYPSKHCQNLRIVKRNGQLHRLCEFHRAKANVNQRRLEECRRMRNSASTKDAAREASYKVPHTRHEETSSSARRSLPDLVKPQDEWVDLDDEDMQFLDEFLSQTDIDLSPPRVDAASGVSGFLDNNPNAKEEEKRSNTANLAPQYARIG